MTSKTQAPPSAELLTATSSAPSEPMGADKLRAELAAQKDFNLRLVADFANFRRRTREDAERQALAQKEAFIHEMLPVADNLERALASGASPTSRQLRQGVELTMRQLQQLLHRHGIENQETDGQSFDPRLHEAVSQRRDPNLPDHAILEVLQRGYRRGTTVLRPAKVVINEPPAS